jgi:peptide/nickel transport system substrate-binding protein
MWAYNKDVPFYPFDQEAAGKLLDEAGFVDDDNDPATPRVANDTALYATPGTKLEFSMYTNAGNTRRGKIGEIAQENWSKIGVKADFKTVDFQVLLDMQDQQTFDVVILGWQNAYPDRADQTQLWATGSDIIGGSNFTSYVNPELDELLRKALTLPGCDQGERAKIYGQIQEILHRDAPYVFVNSHTGMYAWNTRIDGVNPFPGTLYWNINEWSKAP